MSASGWLGSKPRSRGGHHCSMVGAGTLGTMQIYKCLAIPRLLCAKSTEWSVFSSKLALRSGEETGVGGTGMCGEGAIYHGAAPLD